MSWHPLRRLTAWIDRRHGTWRGAVRSLLARLALAAGRLEPYQLRHPQRVRRVVFVCLGNICRSAFAQQVAIRLDMATASLGLSTTTGASTPDSALRAARRQGYDLTAHRAINLSDFEVRPGDLFLVMELWQARALRHRFGARDDVEVALLGLWCTPRQPHLHDPFTLSDAYFDQCFCRLREAVFALQRVVPQAGRGPQSAGARR
ncbi:phosphotyrosine protein phosphatase [Duganella sp. FT94W]|uniref:protein-tyrosine-phosphatase n=1 Tax=Duganella lactea TaxID=2692173 RepID=A0ABW9V8H0_9BURK|nr:phosphotyrosine protein phosphatase [Duganella lactea]MYM35047.1 phosphotyrosine protein phosphatase [Duganella lactea]